MKTRFGLMPDESHLADADISRPVVSDLNVGFEPSAKLRSKLDKIAHRKIGRFSITFPEEADEVYGGHAAVSKAYRHWWKKEVAIKKTRIADDTDLERALGLAVREAELLVGLDHPNIVELEGFVEDLSESIIWLVFPWAYNGNLREFIISRDWKILERISLINDVVNGLAYLHGQDPPICHGDLKSLNVLVDWRYCASITDFGSARRLAQRYIAPAEIESQPRSAQPLQATFCGSRNTITLTGNRYTLRWAAPELLNEDQLGTWSDIWALGWVVYEVMTNSIPFQDVSADTLVVERVIRGDLPSIAEETRLSLIQELCSLVTLCWKSIPAERPTADDCQAVVGWMPRRIPKPTRGADIPDSGVRSLELLIHLGNMRLRRGNYEIAFNSFTEALQTCTDTDDKSGRASALWGLAEVHRQRCEYSNAIKLHSQALDIRTELGDHKGTADAMWGLAEVHRQRCEYKEAIKLYSQAMATRTKLGDRKGKADALWGLAEVHRHRCEYIEAVQFYSQALGIRTELGDRKGEADVLWGLAEVHQHRREDSKAIELYSQTLEIRTELTDRKGTADSLRGLADIHRLQYKYKEAIKLYSQAFNIRTELGDRATRTALSDRKGEAENLWGLAEVHRRRCTYKEAIKLYSKALGIRAELGDRKGTADTLCSLAEVHQHQREYNIAAELYSQASEIRTKLGDRTGKVPPRS
ncbi:hypothetical protein M407DRAFT_30607 [Tulasnella calospora MUT 4182]|uniref:Protein kinase domain-containing protein n=1 Tax=Tulasnella calospora MUT 4182 TaxID=1051891 RepID=A0A0C3Q735_9AGAM|nr:hypothetical protein M407DRAFT_30607 [Tulasnella calospora MUT 4182]